MRFERRATRTASARRARRSGQSLVEFALIAPLLISIIFGILEAGAFLYVYNSAEHAATIGQQVVAADGALGTTDVAAINAMHDTDFGHTAMATLTEVDIYKLAADGSGTRSGPMQKYVIGCHGLCITTPPPDSIQVTISGTWPPSARNTTEANGDYVEMDLHYTFNFMIVGGSRPQIVVARFFREEPQSS